MTRARVLGPYEVLGSIGLGGMALVYAVRHPQLLTRRALKVVALASPALQERFAREARLQGRVRHENVLPLLDVVQTELGLGRGGGAAPRGGQSGRAVQVAR